MSLYNCFASHIGRNNLKGHLAYKWPIHEEIYTNMTNLTIFPTHEE